MMKKSQSGFTLIEILVSVVVAAIGLLGVARLQMATLQNNNSSQYRSIAIQIASDLLERMRSNQDGVNLSAYNRVATTRADALYNTPVPACTTVAGCDSTERASQDAADAMAQARNLLPGGAVIVCIDSGTSGAVPLYNGVTITPQCDGIGTTHAVKIFWLDDRVGNDRSNPNGFSPQGSYTAFVTRGTP